jgi:amidohydrolase
VQSCKAKIDADARQLENKVIEWRRHFHQFPELSNREFNTGAKVASYLKSFGLEVQYPVAKTGVVAILKGTKPGPVVALRADMDALPSQNEARWTSRRKRKPFTQEKRQV